MQSCSTEMMSSMTTNHRLKSCRSRRCLFLFKDTSLPNSSTHKHTQFSCTAVNLSVRFCVPECVLPVSPPACGVGRLKASAAHTERHHSQVAAVAHIKISVMGLVNLF